MGSKGLREKRRALRDAWHVEDSPEKVGPTKKEIGSAICVGKAVRPCLMTSMQLKISKLVNLEHKEGHIRNQVQPFLLKRPQQARMGFPQKKKKKKQKRASRDAWRVEDLQEKAGPTRMETGSAICAGIVAKPCSKARVRLKISELMSQWYKEGHIKREMQLFRTKRKHKVGMGLTGENSRKKRKKRLSSRVKKASSKR